MDRPCLPRSRPGPGRRRRHRAVRQLSARGQLADMIWEAPADLTAEHGQLFRAAIQAYHAGQYPGLSRGPGRGCRAVVGQVPGRVVPGLGGEPCRAGADARRWPDQVLPGQAAALGGGLLRASLRPARPPEPARPQHCLFGPNEPGLSRQARLTPLPAGAVTEAASGSVTVIACRPAPCGPCADERFPGRARAGLRRCRARCRRRAAAAGRLELGLPAEGSRHRPDLASRRGRRSCPQDGSRRPVAGIRRLPVGAPGGCRAAGRDRRARGHLLGGRIG